MWIAVAVVLLVAAAAKGRDVRRFAAELDGYRLLPRAPLLVARAVVVLEAVVGVLVIVPGTRVLGCVVAAALFTGFTAATASVVARGVVTRCGCFGGAGELDLVGPPTVVRAAALVVVAVFAALFPASAALLGPLALAAVLVSSEIARLLTLPRRFA